MMKKKKIFPALMATVMTLCLGTNPVYAEEKGPYIDNPSFEKVINKNENQMYKAERTTDEAYEGKYSIKIGMLKPDDESKVPLWRYTQGKGSVNVVIHNVKPNTEYKVTTHYKKASAVKMSTGVVDIDGKHATNPWQLASSIKTSAASNDLEDKWYTHEHTITTGPRTNEIYAFAYTEWTGNEQGSGLFYVDGFSVEETGKTKSYDKATIGYKALASSEFPATVPAIQSFEKKEGSFYLNDKKQVFSTDSASKEKTKYLADRMKEKGIIKDYEIKNIKNVEEGKGIVVVKQPIQFDLPQNIKDSKIDAYQIDVTENKVVVYSNYIEGIQNGTMTLLQAFTQRKVLPAGSVHDYTDQVVRGLQVDSGRRYYSIDWLKREIEQMAYYKQNKLQLRLKDNEGIRYDSKVASAMRDDKGGYWTQKEVNELVNYAKKFNIEVIPEIDFPGHAEQDAAYYKDWGLGGSTKALDFSREDVRKYMIDVYKEAVRFFDADTIHIGGDEFFQSGYTNEGEKILTAWAKEVTGNLNATDKDAIKLFFNEASEELKKEFPGINVLVWNDNIFDLNGVVPLNKDIVVDFWAGTIYGSIKASDTVNAGYQVMSSSSSNYHDLWPQQGQNKLDRPAPKNLYENFNRYLYSKAAFGYPFYNIDETLTNNKELSLGQMFPIWDDAHGYVPEYILSRTLFPRYGGFAFKTWGADYINEMTYAEFEGLLFELGTVKEDLFPQVEVNYTKADLDVIIAEIESMLKTKDSTLGSENVELLRKKINEIKSNPSKFEKDGFYNDIVATLVNQYENIDFVEVADYTAVDAAIEKVNKLNKEDYVDFSKVEAAVNAVERDLRITEQDKVDAMAKAIEDAITALVKKPTSPSNPDTENPDPGNPEKPDGGQPQNPDSSNPEKPDGNQSQNPDVDVKPNTDDKNDSSHDNVKTGDETSIIAPLLLGTIALGGILIVIRAKKKEQD